MRFLDYSRLYTSYPGLDDIIKRTLVTGKLILQSDVESFEKRLAKWLGIKYVVGLNSGTDAILLAIKAIVAPGKEIITSTHTFKSTIGSIVNAGCKPVLVDIDENGLMDLDEVARNINKNTGAIIPVHLTGDMVDMDKLLEIAGKIPVIEDACQALGATWGGQKAGTFGVAGCFSFYPAKILGAFGDAGAMVTNFTSLKDDVSDARNHYKENNWDFGINSRLDNLQAAVLNEKLDFLDIDIAKRQTIANIYNHEFEGLPIKLPSQRAGRVWQDYVIKTQERDDLYDYLQAHDIETLKNEYPLSVPKEAIADVYESETLRIPCNQFLLADEVNEVVEKIKKFYD